MKNRTNNNLKLSKKDYGITLIALVVTIIVLLILTGITISMITGDNGILTRAADAKTKTERASVIEQAKTDVLGYQVENKDEDLDKSQLKAILDNYFDEVPDLTDMEKDAILNTELHTISTYGTHTITVSEIYNGNFRNNNVQNVITFKIKVINQGNELEVFNYSCNEGDTWYDWASLESEPIYTNPEKTRCGYYNGSLQNLIIEIRKWYDWSCERFIYYGFA